MKSFKKSTMLLLSEKSAHNYHFLKEILIFTIIMILATILSVLFTSLATVIVGVSMLIFSNGSEEVLATLPQEGLATLPQWFIIISLFATVFMIILPIIYCTRFEKRSLKSMGFFKKGMFKEYILGFGIGAFMITICLALCVLLGAYTIEWMPLEISFGIIFLFFLGYLVQGMAEEVICRGYLMNTLTKRYSIVFAIIISSFLFGMMHLVNEGFSVVAMFNLMLFGVFASVYMLRKGSIIGVCAIHSAWNFVQGNIFGISVSGLPQTESVIYAQATNVNVLISGGSFGLEGSFIVTIVLLIGILICFKMPQQDPAID